MNEIFKTLRDKFPFLSLIRKGDMEFVGIVQNQDNNVTSFYDYGRLMHTFLLCKIILKRFHYFY